MYISGFDAKTVMWRPITLLPEQTLTDARKIMMKYNISRIVVAKRGKPLGVVTEKDIARFLYEKVPSRKLDEIRLDEVMSKELITVDPEMDLRGCARLMLKEKISSLLVVDPKNNLKGLLTKTDLVTAFEEYFAFAHKVKEFMVDKVVTVEPDEPIHTTLLLMARNQISRVVVKDSGHPIGIITSRDLLALGAYFGTTRQKTKKDYLPFIPSGVKALMVSSDVMTAKPITTTPDSDLAEAAYIMFRNRISGLPVVDSKGVLVGIVTKTDVVRALAARG
jgi:CBS domain-containing protein